VPGELLHAAGKQRKLCEFPDVLRTTWQRPGIFGLEPEESAQVAASSDRSALLTRAAALAWLDRRLNFERTTPTAAKGGAFDLGTMRLLLRELGGPEQRFRAVHVAGTKGKGSTVAMLAGVLTAAGHRVGCYLSPHVHALEERISVGGRPITAADLVKAFADVMPVVDRLDASAGHGRRGPTWFEVLTAVAFVHFARSGIELAVIETGLGGRLDATNLSRPVLSIITSISLDHTRLLGKTIKAIATEKAGIIKRGCPVISAAGTPTANAVITATAARRRARLLQLGRDFACSARPLWPGADGLVPQCAVEVVNRSSRMPPQPAPSAEPYAIGMAGPHQVINAGVVAVAARMLDAMGWPISEAAVAVGIRDTRLPARVEIRSRRPLVVVDAAHNVDSMKALVAALAPVAPRHRPRVLVFAASGDKQIEAMLGTVRRHFDHIVVTRYRTNPRAAPVERLVTAARHAGMRQVHMADDPPAAMRMARRLAGTAGMVCVAGSFFLAAEVC
jgi:dihydrofolate synthase / folylpolyglutamate synthase